MYFIFSGNEVFRQPVIRTKTLGAQEGGLLVHASWLVANLRMQIRDHRWCARNGLKRKSHRICISKSEELERKARFLARSAKNAPEDGRFPV
ncbi:MAG: hypothetical protein LBK13_11865 [Spirochaetales bacterium]|jgi:hypothetical protein|nr:hypothetical protein [Spirochaetales bacterium]